MAEQISSNTFFLIHDICKDFILKEYPDEGSYFDTIWRVMSSLIQKWRGMPPEKWPFRKSKARTIDKLAFTGSGIDLTSPLIIAVVAATVWHIGSLGRMPEEGEVSRVVSDYCKRFGAEQLTNKISSVIPLLYDSKLPAIIKPRRSEYEVWINGERNLLERSELEEERKRKAIYDLWIDETINEVLFMGEPLKLTNLERGFLIELLVLNKEIATYEHLKKKVWKTSTDDNNIIHQIRTKIIEDVAAWEGLIINVPGKERGGYRLSDDFRYSHCVIRRSV